VVRAVQDLKGKVRCAKHSSATTLMLVQQQSFRHCY
jgi:hypothetical protein